MENLMNRRLFIKKTSLAGLSLTLYHPVLARILRSDNLNSIQNEFFSVLFDQSSRLIHIISSDGVNLVTGIVSAINFNNGKRLISSSLHQISVEIHPIKNQLGSGKLLKITGTDQEQKVNLEIRISLIDQIQAIIVESVCKNITRTEKMNIYSFEPLRAIKSEGGYLNFDQAAKCLTNGAIYYDAGMIHTFGTPYQKPEPYGETKGGVPFNKTISADSETVRSWWNVSLFNGYDRKGITMGYLKNHFGLGQILISKNNEQQISFLAESVFSAGYVLNPGESIFSDPFVINVAENPYQSLETYAAMVGKVNNARTKSIINGWCNWFYTHEHVTEEEIIRNAEFAARELKPYGFEYIQVDEGYQRWHGDWEGNERFPHGMKWLSEKITDLGLKPALWVAPYVISEPTEVFQKHPDWLLKNEDGSLKRVGPWPGEDTDWFRNENPKRYGLDITHPEAEKWFYNLFDTLAHKWKYQMIKIDFVAWSVLSAQRFYDNSFTPASVYRKGAEIIRQAIGNDCHLLTCGPGNISVGMIDSMRIEYDQNYGFFNEVWNQYFTQSASSAPAVAKRYYFHQQTWVNDADHICIDLLSAQQAQAVVTLIAMSGGNTMSGDRLTELDSSKIELLKKTLPSAGNFVRPVDLFDTDLEMVFASKITKEFGEWMVLAFFNPDLTQLAIKKYPMERFWMNSNKTYIGYDFWNERLMEINQDEIEVNVVPGGVTLMAVHEKTGFPQVVSTDRHIMQGAVELTNVSFDSSTGILKGVSSGSPGTSHNIKIYIPESYSWFHDDSVLFSDFDQYSIKLIEDQVMRIHVNFDTLEQVEWKVEFKMG